MVLGGLLAAGVVPASGASTAPAGAGSPVAESGYRLKVDAVAYYLPGRTASGLPVGKGVVAVDPKLIPLGTRLFVPGYGRGIAADVGVAIKGRIIDLWMPTHTAAQRWGRKTVTITVYP
jgi:3D (Asp-Asp-Asp) domain-containing protein